MTRKLIDLPIMSSMLRQQFPMLEGIEAFVVIERRWIFRDCDSACVIWNNGQYERCVVRASSLAECIEHIIGEVAALQMELVEHEYGGEAGGA